MITFRARPAEYPIAMPDQAFKTGPTVNHRAPKSQMWRKVIVFSLALLLAAWATIEMYNVLNVSGVTVLEKVLLAVFSLNISWIAYAFVSSTIGFLAAMAGLLPAPKATTAPATQMIAGRTVVVFPIYNENVERVFATVEATAESLANAPGRFECFILSDTNDPEIALEEEAAFERLRSRIATGSMVHYRRRTMNLHRKATHRTSAPDGCLTGDRPDPDHSPACRRTHPVRPHPAVRRRALRPCPRQRPGLVGAE